MPGWLTAAWADVRPNSSAASARNNPATRRPFRFSEILLRTVMMLNLPITAAKFGLRNHSIIEG